MALFKKLKDDKYDNFDRLRHMSMRLNVNPLKQESTSQARRRKSTSVLAH